MGLSALLLASFLSLSQTISAFSIEKRAAVDNCLLGYNISVFEKGSANYTQAAAPFNRRVPFTPAAFAVPLTIQHVQNAISCGRTNGIKVTAKSGGHSYGSHGLGGEDGHLIVDMRHFNSVTVDQEAQTAIIGTGGRLGNVATALYSQGKQAISHGTCPGVGVGGLTLGGGYGLISRTKGLTLDHVLEATVVLANSSVVTASETENPDLFWALRGAGPAFGIITNFKFKTFTAPENNIVFQYYVSIRSASQLSAMLTALQDFTRNSQPPELNMRLFIARFSTFSGVYFGTRANFDKVMNPLLESMNISAGNSSTVTTNSWLNTLTSFSNGPLKQPEVYRQHENFFAKSLMPEWLSPAAIDALSEYWEENARSNSRAWFLLIDSHGGVDSAVSNVPADATAYPHRNATFKMQFYDRIYNGDYDPAWLNFLNGWVGNITAADPDLDHAMYVNYADTSLSPEDAHKNYWLKNYDRLVQVKQVWDPENLFTGPQLVGS